MQKVGSLELFAALVDQLPLETRADLEWMVRSMRGRREWTRALEHARQQAREMGLSLHDAEDGEPAPVIHN